MIKEVTKKHCAELIKKHLGKDIKNCNFRSFYKGTVGVFENEMEKDFYFIPITFDNYKEKTNPKFEGGTLKIFKIPQDNFSHYVNIFEKDGWIKYDFEKSQIEKIYDGKDEFSIVEKTTGDEISFQKLSARDYACLMLKVPESTKEWLNELIDKKYE